MDRIEWVRPDLTVDEPPTREFDLVSARFLQSPLDFVPAVALPDAASRLRTDGDLWIVNHAAAPSWPNHAEAHFPTPDEVVEALELDPSQWQVEHAEVVVGEVTNPDGHPGTMLDAVVKVRRQPS